MADSIDLLRIIARDGGRLDSADRAAIAEAANEFEQMQHMLLATQTALIEANAQRIALNERLVERERPKPMSMSSGWVRVPLDGWMA